MLLDKNKHSIPEQEQVNFKELIHFSYQTRVN